MKNGGSIFLGVLNKETLHHVKAFSQQNHVLTIIYEKVNEIKN